MQNAFLRYKILIPFKIYTGKSLLYSLVNQDIYNRHSLNRRQSLKKAQCLGITIFNFPVSL